MHILIVDEDLDILKAFRECFLLFDYKVDIFQSPVQALKIVQQTDYDAVITEIKLPEMSGLIFIENTLKIKNNINEILSELPFY